MADVTAPEAVRGFSSEEAAGPLTSLWSNFFRWNLPQMRAFHMSWFAFFLCFFAWFGIAPLMPIVRDELHLTPQQIGWSIIASVAVTVIARLAIGWLCDRIGPRRSYTGLLLIGSLPVMGMAFVDSPTTFLVCRLMIGMIGASFVITQYHTSVMFSSGCVGTANATSAGWGNLGGGVTQILMPLLVTLLAVGAGVSDAVGWRLAMFLAGLVCMVTGVAYYWLTQDTPQGDHVRRSPNASNDKATSSFLIVCCDARVWALFLIYGACFGIELTMNNIAALYFVDSFGLGLQAAGATAALFGLMNIFARTLGGMTGDFFGRCWGPDGRTTWLFMVVLCEGIALMLFSQARELMVAIPILVLFSLCVQMAEGATFAVVPFVRRESLGVVAGIVGAGGNAGAVAAGFLFQGNIEWSTALLVLGGLVTLTSVCAFAVRIPEAEGEPAAAPARVESAWATE